jgi:hypothetical protein
MASLFGMTARHNNGFRRRVLLSPAGEMSVREAATHLALADQVYGAGHARNLFRIAGTDTLYRQLVRMVERPGNDGSPAPAAALAAAVPTG